MNQGLLNFKRAVQAIDSGDLQTLESLLDEFPELIDYRCYQGEWYEQGYFSGATLLNHITGNPNRGVGLPSNIFDIANLLLSRGAKESSESPKYTVGLLLTSKAASEAGLAVPLIELISKFSGICLNLDDPHLLDAPLTNCAPETAELLVQKGAKVELRHAAALGYSDQLRMFLAKFPGQDEIELALTFACIRGQFEASTMLVENGAKGDVLVSPGGQTQRTALHEAANRGFGKIVQLLVSRGADVNVTDSRWEGTAADWAYHGGHKELWDELRNLQTWQTQHNWRSNARSR